MNTPTFMLGFMGRSDLTDACGGLQIIHRQTVWFGIITATAAHNLSK